VTESVVDVGIPTYGRPRFVVEAIESVLAQTHADFRLLVAEDGAGGGEIAAALAPYLEDRRVRYEPSGAHLGAASNMSRIIESGEAPYVAILHDDDRWHPTWLESRVRFLEEHPDCGMVFGEHYDIDDAGRRVGRSDGPLNPGQQEHVGFAREMQRRNLVGTPTVMVRRTTYEQVGPAFDARHPMVYDWEMMLRLALAAPAGYLRVWDSDYRTHTHQISAEATRGREYLELFEAVCAQARAAGPEFELPPGERRRLHARYLVSAALDEIEARNRGAAVRLLRAAVREHPAVSLSPGTAAALVGLAFPAAAVAARRRVYRNRLRPDRSA
jgi:glycosyltransferase involved in cell wall biosynthesis